MPAASVVAQEKVFFRSSLTCEVVFPSFAVDFKLMGLTWCSWSCGHLMMGLGQAQAVAVQVGGYTPEHSIVINFSGSVFISL